jgi:hypothetical protein
MILVKKLVSYVKILIVCAVLILSSFTSVAMADTNIDVLKSLPVEGGDFKYSVTRNLPVSATIRSAVVALAPVSETGTIDAIVITGPNGKREFACSGLKVQNGTDLIQSCGGPAVLESGDTTYTAIGSGFSPNSKTRLSVDLKS